MTGSVGNLVTYASNLFKFALQALTNLTFINS